MFGTPEQKARFLPGIAAGTELWCQGYSEPGAGSDLAGLRTRASLRDGEWHIDGQKIWTSLAHVADWCFLLARTEAGSDRHRGLSCLLVPVRQPGIEIRPIMQITGTAEFNEVFFDDARTAAGNVAGEPGDGWRVALGMLGVERGVSNLGQLIGFQREFESVLAAARGNGSIDDPDIAARIADAWIGLQVLRFTTEDDARGRRPGPRLSGTAANITKLLWTTWHQRLGELAVDVAGAGRDAGRPGLRPDRHAAAVPVRPRRDDLRRVERDPAEHRRRARARPAQGIARWRLRNRPPCARRCATSAASTPGLRAWSRLTGELGLTGLAVPECHGGAGAGLAEVAVAVEETGRVLLPAPYLSTALAGAVLSEGRRGGQRWRSAEFLPGIASGALRAAFAARRP